MDIEDLRHFLVIAQCSNLQKASIKLSKTAGALSKVVKRLEAKLDTQLFDRVGRNIILNQQGERFRQYAQHIVHESDQMLSEFGHQTTKHKVNITGPSVLVQYWLPKLITQLSSEYYELNLNIDWEGQALSQVEKGAMHLALATKFAASERSSLNQLVSITLGETRFTIVASPEHSLFERFPDGRISTEQLPEFVFACPSVSPFCGITRGVGSDGWQDEIAPRTIGYRCNDFSVLISLVKQGLALAYVPDFIAEQYQLKTIDLVDYHEVNKEEIALYYQPSLASGWLNKLIASVEKSLVSS